MVFLFGWCAHAQFKNRLTVHLDENSNTLHIQQEWEYPNMADTVLEELYFLDWANAYYDKDSELAKRFAQEFKKNLHFTKEEDRGRTDIINISDAQFRNLNWTRTPASDILRIDLKTPLGIGQSTKFTFTYDVKLPDSKFTDFGYGINHFFLKDWYLVPATFRDGQWLLDSNKNLDDRFSPLADTHIEFHYPAIYELTSNFDSNPIITESATQNKVELIGKNRDACEIHLRKSKRFKDYHNPGMVVVSDMSAPRLDAVKQDLSMIKVMNYVTRNLGHFPHATLLITERDYGKNPIYGLSQLPSFIRPYDEAFIYELKLLKTSVDNFLKESLHIDRRREKWVHDALLNYFMIDYVKRHYPDTKLIGKLSKMWAVRHTYLAKMGFNDQYPLLYMLTVRTNLHQPLTTPNDSLVKFNQRISNPYKSGLGLTLLEDYLGKKDFSSNLKGFISDNQGKSVRTQAFEDNLQAFAEQDISWYFEEYVEKSNLIDFKIREIEVKGDSMEVTLKNKTGVNLPVSVFGVRNDTIISKFWYDPNPDKFNSKSFPYQGEDKLILNYDNKLPEFNQRNNTHSVKPSLFGGKPIRFQFFKDIEDPYKHQIFYVPVLTFNAYDGITPGIRFHNKSVLRRPFVYDFTPSYAIKEKSLVGSAKLSYTHNLNKSGHYYTSYTIGGSTFHFEENSRYKRLVPRISLGWRPEDRLSNKRKYLTLRYVMVQRDLADGLDIDTEPDYGVLNARFTNVDNHILDYFLWSADAQHAADFSKISFTTEYRHLFENNRQLNLRFFAGKFLRNNSRESDYFSFALDRPTDYLFDYNYLGRSEDSGILSQQIIIAEGGFKSQLDTPFANDWIATVNGSVSIWRWIEFYSDFGFVKNYGQKEEMVYDSGIRLNLVTDYFELYFPLYSNNGWEVGQDRYDQKIRFVITLSPKTLLGLFNRKWF
ncbi:gluzincin family metallopeptidase [Sediminicola luteus]|uniref:metalloprotease n=1 Tax=Sediminicola luteus TaxID=319238 RepID=UPI001FEC438A|nr:metalloprotease [Sediminicola luteus]